MTGEPPLPKRFFRKSGFFLEGVDVNEGNGIPVQGSRSNVMRKRAFAKPGFSSVNWEFLIRSRNLQEEGKGKTRLPSECNQPSEATGKEGGCEGAGRVLEM